MKKLIYGCTTSIIPADGSVTSIGTAFERYANLTSIVIPEGVISIADGAFWGCSNLVSITIPASVTDLVDNPFTECLSLADIHYLGTMEQWNSIEKDPNWGSHTGDFIIHCTDGDIPKS